MFLCIKERNRALRSLQAAPLQPKARGRSPCSPHPAQFLAQMTPLQLTAMQHWLWVLSRPAEIHGVLRDEAICCLSAPLRAARAKIHPKKKPQKSSSGEAEGSAHKPSVPDSAAPCFLLPGSQELQGIISFFLVKNPP